MWPPLSAGTLFRVHPPDSFQPFSGEKETRVLPILEGGMRRSIAREGFLPSQRYPFVSFPSAFYSTLLHALLSPPILSPIRLCVSFIISPFLCPAEIAENGRNNFLSGFCGIDLEVCGKIRFALTHSLSLSLSLGNRMTRDAELIRTTRVSSSFFPLFVLFFVKEERIGEPVDSRIIFYSFSSLCRRCTR